MTRKMLPEVAELRQWIRAACKAEGISDRYVLALASRAVRAVREDDARVARGKNDACGECAEDCAALIRARR